MSSTTPPPSDAVHAHAGAPSTSGTSSGGSGRAASVAGALARPATVEAHACGKVILLGEHAVVHGRPALAGGLRGGVSLRWEETETRDPARLQIPCWDLDVALEPGTTHPVAAAALAVLDHTGVALPAGSVVHGTSALPSRAGLGSSAALTVALARLALGPSAAAGDLVDASLAGERVFHGAPSGVDSWLATTGGVSRFVRGEVPTRLPLVRALELVVVRSDVPRSTADQVAKVAARLERLPSVIPSVLDAMAALVEVGSEALLAGDLTRLGETFDVAHGLLNAVDVGHPVLDALCARARAAGALGAKLTGAGGGGAIVALPAAGEADTLAAALVAEGLGAFAVSIDPCPA